MHTDRLTSDDENPDHRCYRNGYNILEYTLEGLAISIDWVEGSGFASMLNAVLAVDGKGIHRVYGYTSDKLDNMSDQAIGRIAR